MAVTDSSLPLWSRDRHRSTPWAQPLGSRLAAARSTAPPAAHVEQLLVAGETEGVEEFRQARSLPRSVCA